MCLYKLFKEEYTIIENVCSGGNTRHAISSNVLIKICETIVTYKMKKIHNKKTVNNGSNFLLLTDNI
jgi:hypothetical protein